MTVGRAEVGIPQVSLMRPMNGSQVVWAHSWIISIARACWQVFTLQLAPTPVQESQAVFITSSMMPSNTPNGKSITLSMIIVTTKGSRPRPVIKPWVVPLMALQKKEIEYSTLFAIGAMRESGNGLLSSLTPGELQLILQLVKGPNQISGSN